MNNKRRKKRIIIFVAALAIIVVSIYSIKTYLQDKALADRPPPGSVVVELTQAKQQQWGTVVNTIGTIQSFSGITVRAQIAGRITAVNAVSGSNVKQGDVLIEINPQILRAQLQEDLAALELSRFEFEAKQKLRAQGVISQEELIEAESQFHIDQGAVAATQQQLDLASSRAEFDGRLGLINVEIGDEVAVGDELVTLQVADRLRVEFAIPQRYVGQVNMGDTVTMHADLNDQGESYQGVVYAIEPLVDEATRTVSLRAEVPPGLTPGSYVGVSLMLDDRQSVVTVPQTALLKSLYGDYVYLVVDGKAKQTAVTLGPRQAGTVVISKGIHAGDTVVSAGLRKVHDGAAVTDDRGQKTEDGGRREDWGNVSW